jgi:tRNA (adenine37-N6)-methyltransferase
MIEIRPFGHVGSSYQKKEDPLWQGRFPDNTSEIVIDERYLPGLEDIKKKSHLDVLSWFDQTGRTTLIATPPHEKIEACIKPARNEVFS